VIFLGFIHGVTVSLKFLKLLWFRTLCYTDIPGFVLSRFAPPMTVLLGRWGLWRSAFFSSPPYINFFPLPCIAHLFQLACLLLMLSIVRCICVLAWWTLTSIMMFEFDCLGGSRDFHQASQCTRATDIPRGTPPAPSWRNDVNPYACEVNL
jgi:hypothetical protein